MEEFYRQGDKERDLGMPISYAFDRQNPVTQSKFQLVSLSPFQTSIFYRGSLKQLLDRSIKPFRKWREFVFLNVSLSCQVMLEDGRNLWLKRRTKTHHQ
jgi:hypothetical protein